MRTPITIFVAVFCSLIGAPGLRAQNTAFTYQGRLTDSGGAANGNYDLRFMLYDSVTNGAPMSAAVTNAATSVSNGLFAVTLDFGASAFNGADRWLEIGVRTNGSAGAFQLLSPRQLLTATPYAVRAANFSGAVSDSQLSANMARLNGNQTFSGAVNFSSTSNNFAGSFTGNGVGVTNVPGAVPWQTVIGTDIQAQPNMGYAADNAAQVAIHLPTDANVGDVVRIDGLGAGGWRIEPGPGQFLNMQPGLAWGAHESNRSWISVASSADGSKLVAVANGSQIFTSTDCGETWTPRENSRNWISVASSADGSKLVAGTYGAQIYTSTDGGTNWTARENNRNWRRVASSADGFKQVALEFGGPIYISTDCGTNWIARENNRQWIGVASSADGSKLVAGTYGGQIYTSTDGGTNWTARENNRVWGGCASSADGTKLVAVVLNGPILTSVNGGTNWTQRESSRQWSEVASSADGSKLVALDYNGRIYVSTDRGMKWVARESVRYWQSIASSSDGRKLVAAVNGGPIYTSTLVGSQGSMVDLQYAGGGIWQPMNSLDAANISGTLEDARLSANVALRTGGNFFTGYQTFAGGGVSVTDGMSVGGRLTVGGFLNMESTSTAGSLFAAYFGPLPLAEAAALPMPLLLNSAGGNVGIGTTNPAFTLEVNGSAGKPGGGLWSSSSDQRLKKNVRPLAGALDKLLALRGVNFEYIDPKQIHELSGERMGLIAQEVEKVFPDWVETGTDGYKRVTVRGLEALVVEALRELRQQQDVQAATLKHGQDMEIQSLRQRLERLEKLLPTPTP